MNMERENAWNGYETEELKKVDALNQEYRTFLNEGKTERECVKLAVKMAEEAGYRDLKEVIAKKETLKAGDKVYAVGMKKMISLFQIGKKPLEEGMAILGAHIDSPRLDIKQNPLYEEGGFAYLDTHYYGGIKKYQWVTLPLAIHGVIAKKDGTVVDVKIGEDKEDPVFCVTDLLIHLSADRMEKKANKVIEGEELDLLFGSKPLKGKEKEAVKQLLAPMKIRLEEIKATDLRQSIGDLAEGKKNVLTAPFTGSAPQESLMVFCGVNEKHFDKILFELRRKQIPVDYKAVLTPSNRKWSVLMLMLELTKEKNSFRQGN